MCLRKTGFSYLSWLILMLFAGSSCTFMGMILAQMTGIHMLISAVLIVTCIFGTGFALYLITGYKNITDKIKKLLPKTMKFTTMLERIIILALLVVGLIVRVIMISTAGEDASYFEIAKVTQNDGIMVQSVQGSVYFYCVILHGLFYIFGNNWIAGIWLQIILQMTGAVIMYYGIRKILGRLSGFFVLSISLFSPFCIKQSLTYSPQMLYFIIYAIVFYLIADVMMRSTVEEEIYPIINWIYILVIGVLSGICLYTDIIGSLLIIFILSIPFMKRDFKDTLWTIRTCCCIIAIVFGFISAVFIDSVLSQTMFINVLKAWKIIYSSFGFNYNMLINDLTIDFVFVIALVCMGCFSFWRNSQNERFTPFVLMTFGGCVLLLGGVTTENMNGTYFLYVFLTILASISIMELFSANDSKQLIRYDMENLQMEDNKTINQVELIENPLPLPKKREHKGMDYAIQPDKSKMKYDIFVPENDDFDIK